MIRLTLVDRPLAFSSVAMKKSGVTCFTIGTVRWSIRMSSSVRSPVPDLHVLLLGHVHGHDRTDEEGLASRPLDLLQDALFEALDQTHDDDHRGHADDDAQRRQGRAHLVGAQGLQGGLERFEDVHQGTFSSCRLASRSSSLSDFFFMGTEAPAFSSFSLRMGPVSTCSLSESPLRTS